MLRNPRYARLRSHTPDAALGELAGRQWGVVSLGQLRALGLSDDAVQRRARLGRLRRVHRAVYAVGGAVLPREGRRLAAVMACGEGAVLSHVSAAAHWNLLQYDAPKPQVTAPASRRGAPGSACDAALTAAGYTVVRFTWRQLRDDPQTVADRIRAILRPRGPALLRRARGGPAPA